MKGQYVVSESHLLELFSTKCPLCGSKVKVEKITCGLLLILNQQCLHCEYRNQWKSQLSTSLPAAASMLLRGGSEVGQQTLQTREVASSCGQPRTPESPCVRSEGSGPSAAAVQSAAPSEASAASDAFMNDDSQVTQKVKDIDVISEQATPLDMKGQYVVSESHLLELFSTKCPLCGSNVKIEKLTCGVLLILNQLCLHCEYRSQWKSQLSTTLPTAECLFLAGVPGLSQQTESSVHDDSDDTDDTEESDRKEKVDSDEDWDPSDDGEGEVEGEGEGEGEDEDESESDDEGWTSPGSGYRNSQLCTECGKFYIRRSHTCEHKIKPFSCNICGKRCVSELALNFHSRVHDENYRHPCKFCHVTFKTKVDKLTHEQTHLVEGKPYKCPECPETFATNKERNAHHQDHRGPRQLKCHICGIEFYRYLSLERHLAVHTGEKPFKCSVCQRGFNQASHLKSHMRLHTGERPFKCQHCDKCFNHNVSLKSHVRRYHTSSPASEQKPGKSKQGESKAAQKRRNQTDPDFVLDSDEEQLQMKKKRAQFGQRRSTGRPIGRPKRKAASSSTEAEEAQGQNTEMGRESANVETEGLKRTCVDEEQPAEVNITSNMEKQE